jgi:8-oxo-dGTP diphosphatase
VCLRKHSSTGTPQLRWELPVAAPNDESIDASARRLVASSTGQASFWIEQLRASDRDSGAMGHRVLTIDYVALVAMRPPDDRDAVDWFPMRSLPELSAAEREAIDRAIAMLRGRTEAEPIAFRLLPDVFTLSDVQRAYELLLGRRLHKASFRRALLGARLVEPTDEWRQEQRGRPARLYRSAPRTTHAASRGVRFDRLSR